MYAMVTTLDSKDLSSNGFGFSPVGTATAGQDSRGFGAGLIHKFQRPRRNAARIAGSAARLFRTTSNLTL
ncbi:MAG: hypothetical protein LH481_02070 [Burkholderiales bacterium]|nr:hypothetical protein [Burkholderiales bacterium]